MAGQAQNTAADLKALRGSLHCRRFLLRLGAVGVLGQHLLEQVPLLRARGRLARGRRVPAGATSLSLHCMQRKYAQDTVQLFQQACKLAFNVAATGNEVEVAWGRGGLSTSAGAGHPPP
jgi:hypothetical protein